MKQLSLLIVDDEVELIAALAERLKLRGLQVEVANNGDDALKHTSDTDYDVIILDVRMPGMDGIKLMGEIRSIRPGAKFILLTGQGSDADAAKGMREGASAYMIKPIDIQMLIDEIERAVAEE